MSRSHPPALSTIASRAVTRDALYARGDRVLVAVSGGPDSMALLHVLARLAPRAGIEVVAHGVDHGLRAAAAAELDLAASLAASLGVSFDVTRVQLAAGSNLMARAREARLLALEAAMRRAGASAIATGHHADDRAETVLLRILRGTGLAGLGVLPPRAGILTRPLLRARRSDVLLHLERHGVPFAQDPSNEDPRFLRTRVRREILPRLAELSPQIVDHLCDIADEAAAGRTSPAGAIPAVLGGLRLGRAQRKALGQAAASGNVDARIRLGKRRVAGLELATGQIVVMKEE